MANQCSLTAYIHCFGHQKKGNDKTKNKHRKTKKKINKINKFPHSQVL